MDNQLGGEARGQPSVWFGRGSVFLLPGPILFGLEQMDKIGEVTTTSLETSSGGASTSGMKEGRVRPCITTARELGSKI